MNTTFSKVPFLAPLAEGQRGYCHGVCPSVNFSFKHFCNHRMDFYQISQGCSLGKLLPDSAGNFNSMKRMDFKGEIYFPFMAYEIFDFFPSKTLAWMNHYHECSVGECLLDFIDLLENMFFFFWGGGGGGGGKGAGQLW